MPEDVPPLVGAVTILAVLVAATVLGLANVIGGDALVPILFGALGLAAPSPLARRD